ncbi:hypothetical protein Pyn_38812 [Prunus yedoensis var. nudiflora]|uniref:Uncharacterized protein n=1 Tax=Prunus yedoensis var. nudiflora TaxID=2094558 RepID=A0A314XMH9_PRUYE|nr:hypothetical protein Pyn_38812 [Prunus yedoensis var. nudiflora]
MEGIMGVLSSFRQLDENSVKLYNDLPEEKMGRDGGMGLDIAKVSGMRDNACSLYVGSRMRDDACSLDMVVIMGRGYPLFYSRWKLLFSKKSYWVLSNFAMSSLSFLFFSFDPSLFCEIPLCPIYKDQILGGGA